MHDEPDKTMSEETFNRTLEELKLLCQLFYLNLKTLLIAP